MHILSYYVQGLLWDSGFHNLDHVMVNAQAARQYKIYPRSLSIPDVVHKNNRGNIPYQGGRTIL